MNKLELQKYQRDWYYRHKPEWIERRKQNIQKTREHVNRIKMQPCMDCGIQYNPWQMHFDHRDPSTKVRNVAAMVCGGNRTTTRIDEEIAKCDLVCANCHADRTYKKKHYMLAKHERKSPA